MSILFLTLPGQFALLFPTYKLYTKIAASGNVLFVYGFKQDFVTLRQVKRLIKKGAAVANCFGQVF